MAKHFSLRKDNWVKNISSALNAKFQKFKLDEEYSSSYLVKVSCA